MAQKTNYISILIAKKINKFHNSHNYFYDSNSLCIFLKIKEIKINIGNFIINNISDSIVNSSNYENTHENCLFGNNINYITFFIFKNPNNCSASNIDCNSFCSSKLNVIILFNEKYYNSTIMNNSAMNISIREHSEEHKVNVTNNNNDNNISDNNFSKKYQDSSDINELIPLQNNEFFKSIIVSQH